MKHSYSSWIGLSVCFYMWLIAATAGAQSTEILPYSRFGLGWQHAPSQAQFTALGGTQASWVDPNRLNLGNPATYTYLANPVFNAGMVVDFSNYETSSSNLFYRTGGVNDIAFGTAFAKGKLGMAIGINPYTRVGYRIINSAQILSSDTVSYNRVYEGSGGLNNLHAGLAWRVVDRSDSLNNTTTLAVGASANYIFGTLRYNRATFWPSTFNALGYTETASFQLRDVRMELGLHYQTNLIKRTEKDPSYFKVLAGLVISPSYGQGGRLNTVGGTFNTNDASQRVLDTLYAVDNGQGKFNIPLRSRVSVGFDWVNKNRRRIRASAEYRMQDWSAFDNTYGEDIAALAGDLVLSSGLSLGVEFMPDYSSTKVYDRMEYRIGYRSEVSYVEVNSTPVEQRGITFGIGTPINSRQNLTRSTLNIGVERGILGTTENNLVEQRFWMIHVGLSLTPHFRDLWLVKRKYD